MFFIGAGDGVVIVVDGDLPLEHIPTGALYSFTFSTTLRW